MPQVKEKLSPLPLRPSRVTPRLIRDQLLSLVQQRRSLMGIGIGGGICLFIVGVLIFFFAGATQQRGVRELQAGIQALQGGDMPTAAAQLEIADRHLMEHQEPYLAQLVQLGLGYVAEQRGDLTTARQYYEKGAELEGPAQPEALLATARVLALLKEDETSVSYYKKFLARYPDSPLGEVVRQKVEGK